MYIDNRNANYDDWEKRLDRLCSFKVSNYYKERSLLKQCKIYCILAVNQAK